jgi:hypothetical protein
VHVLRYGGAMYCRLMDMDNVEGASSWDLQRLASVGPVGQRSFASASLLVVRLMDDAGALVYILGYIG